MSSPDQDELFLAGFEIQSSPQGYRWSARFWVDDGDYFPTEQEAIDDCVRSNPNIDAQ